MLYLNDIDTLVRGGVVSGFRPTNYHTISQSDLYNFFLVLGLAPQ
jgi:hypothetical protein